MNCIYTTIYNPSPVSQRTGKDTSIFHLPEVGLYPIDDPNIHTRVCEKFPTQTPTHIDLAIQR